MNYRLSYVSQSQTFFELAKKLSTSTAVPELIAGLDTLDDHLGYRTYLVGHEITAADLAVWGALKGATQLLNHGADPNNLTLTREREGGRSVEEQQTRSSDPLVLPHRIP